ncbi:MAG: hypothetical protein ACREIS_04185, partial [Nitrospiraceae bacterium]
MYRCTDASGASVFSDSTAQLKNCSPMNLTSPVPPATGSAPARFPGRSDPPMRALPLESPDTAAPSPAAAPAVPPESQQMPGDTSEMTAEFPP